MHGHNCKYGIDKYETPLPHQGTISLSFSYCYMLYFTSCEIKSTKMKIKKITTEVYRNQQLCWYSPEHNNHILLSQLYQSNHHCNLLEFQIHRLGNSHNYRFVICCMYQHNQQDNWESFLLFH